MRLTRLPFRPLAQGLAIPRSPQSLTHHLPAAPKCPTCTQQTRLQTSQSMPRITQTSVWTAMIPKFLHIRRPRKPEDNEWNPASFYIIIFILIGSQAIRMIALKNDYAAYTRSTDAKIELLREVIEKVKRGEKVDVEKLLGTGDAAKEREWEDVLREIEDEDSLWHQKAAAPASTSALSTGKPQTQQGQHPPQEERAAALKEPAIPAEEGGTSKEPPTDSQSRRKLNFF